MPSKPPSSRTSVDVPQHAPLHADYEIAALGDGKLKSSSGGKKKRRRGDDDELNEDEDEKFVDSALSRKILQMAREQQDEEAAEVAKDSKKAAAGEDEDEDDDDDDDFEDFDDDEDDEAEYAELEEFQKEELQELEVDNEDASLFEKFLPGRGGGAAANLFDKPVTLADKIMEKLAEQEMGRRQAEIKNEPEFPPKVVEVYEKYANILTYFDPVY